MPGDPNLATVNGELEASLAAGLQRRVHADRTARRREIDEVAGERDQAFGRIGDEADLPLTATRGRTRPSAASRGMSVRAASSAI